MFIHYYAQWQPKPSVNKGLWWQSSRLSLSTWICAQAAGKERTTSAESAPLAVMALPQAPHSLCSKRCCWHLYCTFRASFASLFRWYLEEMLAPNPELVHKSLKCVHLACLRGCSIALRGRMWLVSWSPSPSPQFICDREKIWPGVVLFGRTRYLRYYLFISGTKITFERGDWPWDRLQPSLPACANFPTERAWKQCPKNDGYPAWMGTRKKGIQNSLLPHVTCRQCSYALVKQQALSCVPWQEMSIQKCTSSSAQGFSMQPDKLLSATLGLLLAFARQEELSMFRHQRNA